MLAYDRRTKSERAFTHPALLHHEHLCSYMCLRLHGKRARRLLGGGRPGLPIAAQLSFYTAPIPVWDGMAVLVGGLQSADTVISIKLSG